MNVYLPILLIAVIGAIITFKSSSWKTTLCGVLQGLGGFVMFMFVTLLWHPGVMPHWLKYTFALLFLIGCVGDGYYARDNDKSSEEACSKKHKRAVLLGLLLLLSMVSASPAEDQIRVLRSYVSTNYEESVST